MNPSLDPVLLAPCGLNCALCRAFTRDKLRCPGCRGDDALKMKSCLACHIKNCPALREGKFEYCFLCEKFPCRQVKRLDHRYRTKYGTSVIENLTHIKELGISQFLENEIVKWTCPECGALLCMHKPQCLVCGFAWNK